MSRRSSEGWRLSRSPSTTRSLRAAGLVWHSTMPRRDPGPAGNAGEQKREGDQGNCDFATDDEPHQGARHLADSRESGDQPDTGCASDDSHRVRFGLTRRRWAERLIGRCLELSDAQWPPEGCRRDAVCWIVQSAPSAAVSQSRSRRYPRCSPWLACRGDAEDSFAWPSILYPQVVASSVTKRLEMSNT